MIASLPAADGRLDARAGGQLYERHESGKSLLWCTVTMCEPGVAVQMGGHIAPDWGGPTTSMLKFQLEDRDGTVLEGTDAKALALARLPLLFPFVWPRAAWRALRRRAARARRSRPR